MTGPAGGGIDAWAAALRTVAIVGTARRPAAPAPAALGTPPGGGPGTLLDQAALLDVLARAGARTVPMEVTPAAPEEMAPVAPPEATRLLALLLLQPPLPTELRDELVRVWLETCGEAGRVVAPRLLPDVLALALRRVLLREALGRCWGERGRWLARLRHPLLLRIAPVDGPSAGDLTGELADDLVDRWPTLETTAASAELGRLRRFDAARGRVLLALHWPTLPAKARAAHLAALEEGISLEDEEFLEAALDDRARSVREAAADLLGGLDGSRLRARMGERLTRLITVRRRLLRAPTIEVALPGGVDDAAVRDGLEPATPARAAVQPGEWLARIVSAAPLETWTRSTGLRIDQVVAALDGGNDDLVRLADAVGRAGDARWADALAGRLAHGGVVAAMTPARREAWLLDHAAVTSEDPRVLAWAARAVPQPWSPEVSAALLRRLAASKDGDPFHAAFGTDIVTGLAPTALPVARTLLEGSGEDTAYSRARWMLRTIVAFLGFVQTIREAFAVAPAKETP